MSIRSISTAEEDANIRPARAGSVACAFALPLRTFMARGCTLRWRLLTAATTKSTSALLARSAFRCAFGLPSSRTVRIEVK